MTQMLLTRLCKEFNSKSLRYAIAGGFAVALHGAVRGTVDVDLVLDLTEKNLKLCEDILEYFNQNRAIFDVLEIASPKENELFEELNSYKEKLSPFITNTTNMVWKALDENKKVIDENKKIIDEMAKELDELRRKLGEK